MNPPAPDDGTNAHAVEQAYDRWCRDPSNASTQRALLRVASTAWGTSDGRVGEPELMELATSVSLAADVLAALRAHPCEDLTSWVWPPGRLHPGEFPTAPGTLPQPVRLYLLARPTDLPDGMAACLAAPMQTLEAAVVLDHATDMPTDLVLTALARAGRVPAASLVKAAAWRAVSGHAEARHWALRRTGFDWDLRLAAAVSVLAGHRPATDADVDAVADLLFEFAGSGRIDPAISPDLFAPAFPADLPITAPRRLVEAFLAVYRELFEQCGWGYAPGVHALQGELERRAAGPTTVFDGLLNGKWFWLPGWQVTAELARTWSLMPAGERTLLRATRALHLSMSPGSVESDGYRVLREVTADFHADAARLVLDAAVAENRFGHYTWAPGWMAADWGTYLAALGQTVGGPAWRRAMWEASPATRSRLAALVLGGQVTWSGPQVVELFLIVHTPPEVLDALPAHVLHLLAERKRPAANHLAARLAAESTTSACPALFTAAAAKLLPACDLPLGDTLELAHSLAA